MKLGKGIQEWTKNLRTFPSFFIIGGGYRASGNFFQTYRYTAISYEEHDCAVHVQLPTLAGVVGGARMFRKGWDSTGSQSAKRVIIFGKIMDDRSTGRDKTILESDARVWESWRSQLA